MVGCWCAPCQRLLPLSIARAAGCDPLRLFPASGTHRPLVENTALSLDRFRPCWVGSPCQSYAFYFSA